jgi:hypothetical protein
MGGALALAGGKFSEARFPPSIIQIGVCYRQSATMTGIDLSVCGWRRLILGYHCFSYFLFPRGCAAARTRLCWS